MRRGGAMRRPSYAILPLIMRRFVALAFAILGVVSGCFALSAPNALAKSACICRCAQEYDPVARWTALTGTNQDCRADCAQACDGAANLADSATGGRRVDVSCIPGSSDCRTGAFRSYDGVRCELQYGP